MKKYFISFIHEETLIATFLCDYLSVLFRGTASFFLSANLPSGENWMFKIKKEIDGSHGLLCLLGLESYSSTWIYLETGAFWINERLILPLLFSGLKSDVLQRPMNDHQITYLEDPDSVSKLIGKIAHESNVPLPQHNSRDFCKKFLQVCNRCYKICSTIKALCKELSPGRQFLIEELSIQSREEETKRLHSGIIEQKLLEISGNVVNTAFLKVWPKNEIIKPLYLILEVNGAENTQSFASGQLVKVRMNGIDLQAKIAEQRHHWDGEYIRRKNGYYAYGLSSIEFGEPVRIDLVFWKIIIDNLKLKFFVASYAEPIAKKSD